MTTPPRPPTIVARPTATPPPPTALALTAHRTPIEHTEIGAVSFLLCGAPGSGKTHFGAGMPHPLFFQWDSNMKTLEKWPDIPYVVPSDWMPEGETSTTRVFSERVLPLLEARRAHEITGAPVESIVFDTGTEMADDLATRIVGMKTNERDSIARFGEFLREGHALFRRIADLTKPRGTLPRYNVAVLFHLKDVTDDAGNLRRYSPAIMGRLAGEIQRRFDVGLVMRCRVQRDAATPPRGGPAIVTTSEFYEALTKPTDALYDGLAYDRLGGTGPWRALPPVITDPSYPRLVELWTKGEPS